MSVKLGAKRYTINILKSLNPAMKKIKRESICKLRIHPFSRPEKEEIEVDGSGTFSISLLRNGLVYLTSPLEDFMIVSFKNLTYTSSFLSKKFIQLSICKSIRHEISITVVLMITRYLLLSHRYPTVIAQPIKFYLVILLFFEANQNQNSS